MIQKIISILILLLSLSCLTYTKSTKYIEKPEFNLYDEKNKILLLTHINDKYENIFQNIITNFIKNSNNKKIKYIIEPHINDSLCSYFLNSNNFNNNEIIIKETLLQKNISDYNFINVFSVEDIYENNDKGEVVLRVHYKQEEVEDKEKEDDSNQSDNKESSGNIGLDILREIFGKVAMELPFEIIKAVLTPLKEMPYVDITIESNIYSYSFIMKIILYDIKNNTICYKENKKIEGRHETYSDSLFTSLDESIESVEVIKQNAAFEKVKLSHEIFTHSLVYLNDFNKKFYPKEVVEKIEFKVIGDELNIKFLQLVKKDLLSEALNYMIKNIGKIEKLETSNVKAMHYYNIGILYKLKKDYENCYLFYLKAYNESNESYYYFRLKDIEEM
ncbi:MAG: hypothetical protein KAT05_00670 [Spirochaetes bacterium]|nr:hypothetical protein [Spirochaetota bacterium]